MKSKLYRGIELFLFFVLLPLSYLLDSHFLFKVIPTFFGFIYILVLLKRNQYLKFSLPSVTLWKPFWKTTLIKLFIIIIVTTIYVYGIAPDKLFSVLLKKPGLWVIILFVYTFLSVWPQEIIYRTFFYDRYEDLIANNYLFIFINAILFSLAHIFLGSLLVQILTFLGGLLFAYTYHKTRSTILVSIEHAIYGNWLFTVGMGDMLAFPGAD
ncbi:CPBP family intramembrane glutamic endopeptidase [Aquimarina algicola]|uniref:CPBP family intramembrane metalloprotease n=1 Tax=Aquimarina algicola TaxID=2589995 RepID=A0A504JAW8_9FLAO|nr:CPBP family intramembrane glutamic endopeptidase [Aquimarina algicola]TPN83411.1 CPBP family intramembrane metalloprotease [Aquimarina algicola]